MALSWLNPEVGFAGLIIILVWFVMKSFFGGRKLKLPPGPPGVPVLGSLPFLGSKESLHRKFQKLSKGYGSIIYFRMGWIPTIVVCSAQAAEEVLKTRDSEFCSKPHSTMTKSAMKYIGFEGNQIGMMPYTPQVQLLKKICTTELSSLSRINASAKVRARELARTVWEINNMAAKGETVNLAELSHNLYMNMMTQTLFGKSYHGRNIPKTEENTLFISTIRDHLHLAATMNLADILDVPGLHWLDLQGLETRYKGFKPQLEHVYQKIIDEHRSARQAHREDPAGDFLDALLDLQGAKNLPDQALMAVLSDMLVGGTDTSASTLQWIFMELFRSPKVFAKLQEEIDNVVGKGKCVDISDVTTRMPYLQAFVREILRLHHPTPLLLPRMNESQTTLGGFDIPKKSTVFINAWAINRDPSNWENPLEFLPERFLNSNMNVFGNDYRFLPFGAGRRKCAGINLGMSNLELSVAGLLHAFEWSLPAGKLPDDINMEEVMDVVISPKYPLDLVASPRPWATPLYVP